MKLMQFIKKVLFGKPLSGERVPPPSFKTTYPTDKLDENQWFKEFKFGSRYGHRGSFYKN
jgi:hypothetical protein